MSIQHLLQIKQIFLIVLIGWFFYLIRDKLKGQWFDDHRDRDGTIVTLIVAGLFLYLLTKFGNRFSLEALAGYAMGLLTSLGIIVAFYFKERQNK